MSTQEAPSRPVLRYFGAKFKLAPWVIAHLPPHRLYCEPFGGAGGVLLRKRRSHSEVWNDLDDEVVNVFRVLRDPVLSERLKAACRMTPFARAELKPAYEPCPEDPVEQARRTIFRSFAGFGGKAFYDATTAFRGGSREADVTPAREWVSHTGQLDAFINRLRGVTIESRPAAAVIQRYDAPTTLFYADPPYPHETRTDDGEYRHEMTDADHRALAQVLREVAGMVVLSGYPCALYDEELFSDWQRVTRKALADGARERLECLWMNAACVAGLRRRQGELGL